MDSLSPQKNPFTICESEADDEKGRMAKRWAGGAWKSNPGIVTIYFVTVLSLGDLGRWVFVWNMGQTSAPKVFESPDPTVRRQKMTTWGIVALAVFVAEGLLAFHGKLEGVGKSKSQV